jgi:hypothetical protein
MIKLERGFEVGLEMKNLDWSPELKRFILIWYLLSGICSVFVLILIYLVSGNFGGVIVLLILGIFYVIIWPVGELATILSLGNFSFNPFIRIVFFILFLLVPVVGYLITYRWVFDRNPRSMEELLLPLNKMWLEVKQVVEDQREVGLMERYDVCEHCGERTETDSSYCSHCGKRIRSQIRGGKEDKI